MIPEFLTPLDVRELRGERDGGRQKWVLLAPLEFRSDIAGRVITAPAGLVTDFESVPRLLAALSGPPCPSPGVIHDLLYQTHEVDKETADAIFGEALAAVGLDQVWIAQRQQSVAFYGGSAWDSGPMRLRVIRES